MTHLNIPDFIPRFSVGAGDGVNKLCAMQFISYINGATEITDFPACSAYPLAQLIQGLNDRLAGADGYLSPENSVLVLDLGWQTIGTADVPESVYALWIAEILVNPVWGCVQYADIEGATAIRRIADLHRQAAAGNIPFAWNTTTHAAWNAAGFAARSAAALSATTHAAWNAAGYAAWSATWSATRNAAWSAAGSAATACAAGSAGNAASIDLTRRAITCWRELAQLDTPTDIDTTAVNSELQRIHA